MQYHRATRQKAPIRRSYSQRQPDEERVTTAGVQRRPYHPPDDDEHVAGFPIARLTRRYDAQPMPDGTLYRQGTDQVYIHNGPPPVPKRAHRDRETEEHAHIPERAASRQPGRRVHWLFFVGTGLLLMILGAISFSAFGSWWQIHSDDGTYGRPRTFQTDAVVGHQDSAANPSHFIALNLRGHISIIEFPGGRVEKAESYIGPFLAGGEQDLTPVTLTFSDVNGDGKVDMILHILDQQMVYLNNGTRFVPPSTIARGGGSS